MAGFPWLSILTDFLIYANKEISEREEKLMQNALFLNLPPFFILRIESKIL